MPFNGPQESYLSPLSLQCGSTLTYAIKMTSHLLQMLSTGTRGRSRLFLLPWKKLHLSHFWNRYKNKKKQKKSPSLRNYLHNNRQLLGYREAAFWLVGSRMHAPILKPITGYLKFQSNILQSPILNEWSLMAKLTLRLSWDSAASKNI